MGLFSNISTSKQVDRRIDTTLKTRLQENKKDRKSHRQNKRQCGLLLSTKAVMDSQDLRNVLQTHRRKVKTGPSAQVSNIIATLDWIHDAGIRHPLKLNSKMRNAKWHLNAHQQTLPEWHPQHMGIRAHELPTGTPNPQNKKTAPEDHRGDNTCCSVTCTAVCKIPNPREFYRCMNTISTDKRCRCGICKTWTI